MIWLTRLSIIALLVAAASALWWLDTAREPVREEPPDEAAAGLPDFYFTGFRITRHVAEGPPRQILRGRRLEHYPSTRGTEIDRPRLLHRPAAAPPWRIRADHGTLLDETEVVRLQGNVRLHRPGSPEVRELTLLTSRLTYALQPEIARTDRPVRVLSPGTRVDAVGMTARLAVGHVELHEQVRGRHDPALAGPDGNDG